jgi:hypothetical protein
MEHHIVKENIHIFEMRVWHIVVEIKRDFCSLLYVKVFRLMQSMKRKEMNVVFERTIRLLELINGWFLLFGNMYLILTIIALLLLKFMRHLVTGKVT